MRSYEKPPVRRPKLFKNPPRTLFEDHENDFEAPVKAPLFSRPVFHALLVAFGISLMLTMDWFGLLLLNSKGVYAQIGVDNALHATAVLMAGIALPSALLMHHYRRIHSYTCDKNVFFAITFSISFMLGLPCALAWVFG